MKIFLLSTVYPAKYSAKGTTPVIHYFAKEWAATGNDVHVFHTASCFPKLFYVLGKPFKKLLDTKLGHIMPVQAPVEYDEEKDGVKISHIKLKKAKPHGRYSNKQIKRAFLKISSYVEKEGVPDCFVGHWDNPQLELLNLLKEKYHRPVCLVYHDNHFTHLSKIYGNDAENLVKNIDLVGFRNITAQAEYAKLFGAPSKTFIAASGVSKPFIEAGNSFERKIEDVDRFAFVGSLIGRKYPIAVIEALSKSFQKSPFEMTYIGEGKDKSIIQQYYDEHGCKGSLNFTGRIPRNEVIDYLKNTDVFVMISKGEIFGLVYLEAMALGCITIAARHEGIDGIIEDGVNGFLCEAGNAAELATIISKIRGLSTAELNSISGKAKETANAYTDVAVADNYIQNLKSLTV